jgi:hypothetical protein
MFSSGDYVSVVASVSSPGFLPKGWIGLVPGRSGHPSFPHGLTILMIILSQHIRGAWFSNEVNYPA